MTLNIWSIPIRLGAVCFRRKTRNHSFCRVKFQAGRSLHHFLGPHWSQCRPVGRAFWVHLYWGGEEEVGQGLFPSWEWDDDLWHWGSLVQLQVDIYLPLGNSGKFRSQLIRPFLEIGWYFVMLPLSLPGSIVGPWKLTAFPCLHFAAYHWITTELSQAIWNHSERVNAMVKRNFLSNMCFQRQKSSATSFRGSSGMMFLNTKDV